MEARKTKRQINKDLVRLIYLRADMRNHLFGDSSELPMAEFLMRRVGFNIEQTKNYFKSHRAKEWTAMQRAGMTLEELANFIVAEWKA